MASGMNFMGNGTLVAHEIESGGSRQYAYSWIPSYDAEFLVGQIWAGGRVFSIFV
jgi:hypothetical protein